MIATVTTLTGLLAGLLLSLGAANTIIIAGFVGISASALALAVSSYLSRRIAATASRPLETLIGYLASTEEPTPLRPAFLQGQGDDANGYRCRSARS
ncbi:hypothetical protein LWE61_12935 [Sphingobium sufflavum]|uniref:hypothetical protein n=1 Tax=Sphingobium sufflavum TaxID=1129547 RepID=UPI001F41D762|nr:hypothetical protein [Sphingobium sufflavum]MCE7797460.1 hypothetical protein [Sphingobium sufflavum]